MYISQLALTLAAVLFISLPAIADARVTASDYATPVERTAGLQSQIDRLSASGGGRIVLAPGVHFITSLQVKDGVEIFLEKGATLAASTNSVDYAGKRQPLISGEGAAGFALRGEGTLDGGGRTFYRPPVPYKMTETVSGGHPVYVICFKKCRNFALDGITIRNTLRWTCKLVLCDSFSVHGVTIRNRPWVFGCATDGIDLVSCANVRIERCDIETGDDALVLKSFVSPNMSKESYPVSSNIVVRDCVLASTACNFKFGTETVGDFRDILVERVRLKRHSAADDSLPYLRSKVADPIAAIAIQSCDGANISNVVIRDVSAGPSYCPLQLYLGHRQSKLKGVPVGSMCDVTVENFTCEKALSPIQIDAAEGHRFKNVALRNVSIKFKPCDFGKERVPIGKLPRPSKEYPETRHYGRMPVWGLWARGVENFEWTKVRLVLDGSSLGLPEAFADDIVGKVSPQMMRSVRVPRPRSPMRP